MPPPPASFVNRAKELGLLDRLTSPRSRQAPPVVVVSGTAGTGKSALVQQWARLNRERFPDGIFYADFAWGDVEIQDLLGAILGGLGVATDQMPAGFEDRVELYRARSVGKRLLVLLEDVEQEAQMGPLIPALAPQSAVIATTRAPVEGMVFSGAHRIDVPPLASPAARELLALVAGRARVEGEARAVDELVGMSQGLPLAVRIAAQRLRVDAGLTVGSLVREMASSPDDSTAAYAEGEADFLINGVYRTLPSEAALLYRRLAAHPGPSFTPLIASIAAGDPELSVGGALGGFHKLQLVESRGGRSRFHQPLLRHAAAALRADEPGEERHAAARIADFYATAAVLFGLTTEPESHPSILDLKESGSRWSEAEALAWFDAEWPNLLAVMEDATDRDWSGRAQVIGEALILAVAKREGGAAVQLRNYLAHGFGPLGQDEWTGREPALAGETAPGLSEESVAAFLAEAAAPVVLEPERLRVEWPVEAEPLALERYLASGGESALLRLADESALRVEAHVDSFALVWPAKCSLGSLVERVVSEADIAPEAKSMALIVADDGTVEEVGLDENFSRFSGFDADDIEFVRLDLTDRVVTWRRCADPALHSGIDPTQELGLGADWLDHERVRDLLQQTGVESISAAAERLVDAASGVLNRAPGGERSDD